MALGKEEMANVEPDVIANRCSVRIPKLKDNQLDWFARTSTRGVDIPASTAETVLRPVRESRR